MNAWSCGRALTSTSVGLLYLAVWLTPSGADAELLGKTRYSQDYARANSYEACVDAYLDVGRYKDKNVTSTSLSYYVYNWCDYSLIAQGSGQIPNEAYTGNARTGKVSLNVDVSAIPGFYMYGTPLVANLSWAKTNLYWDSSAGHGENGYTSSGSTFVSRWNGHYESASATVSGTVNIFTPSQGSLSDSVNMSREFEKTK